MSIMSGCQLSDIKKNVRLTIIFNNSIKGDATVKNNYRPISTLPNFLKIFEKVVYNQVSSFVKPKLSKYLVIFHRNHDTQYALLRMIETWCAILNKGPKVGAIIMDLSKAFDTLSHKLILKKLQAYHFDK